MIELNLDTMAVDADVMPQEALDAGASPEVHLQVVGGTNLPLSDPRNPNRPLRYPSIAVNFQLGRDAALQLASLLEEKAQSLPQEVGKGKLEVVKDLKGVDNVVNLEQHLRGK